MNPDLRELIEELRADLEAGQPETLSWAEIQGAVPSDKIPDDVPQPVRELLEVADGILAGAFSLSSTRTYGYFQSVLGDMPGFTRVSDEPDKWFVFGRLHEEPLLLHRETGAVWYFPRTDGDEWYMREEFEGVASDLDSFLAYYVFGAGYAELGADDDEWWNFLADQGVAGSDDEDGEPGA
ncbi:SUKH-4 family immunity protein [Catenuloplanes atrovinosus]|uniref:AraC-like DNA-binding protein n=1 Tax=Catenuloplanes atrovinosus TaxID=137266 RepID=A0AAE3YQ80_9ACTN|nr:SUKH-4 family immunity protein [Catenuloplanes atrovinosus]MDR7276601.1 AraC-like DNA-binding protein [Catenuloplanes atrovinosus]